MKYRKLDESGDYQFGNGNLDFLVDSPETVAQAVLTRLRLWLGEWFLDDSAGTAYQQGVLGKNSQRNADTVMRERILSTVGVTELVSFNSTLDPDLRTYAVSATIDTVYGPAQINEVL